MLFMISTANELLVVTVIIQIVILVSATAPLIRTTYGELPANIKLE